MRQTGIWMCSLDDRILEHLHEEEWASPATMAADLQFNANQAQLIERCRVLAHADLIEPFIDSADADTFEITQWGELYLEGGVDAELRRPEPKPRPPYAERPRDWTLTT
ncbi:repressor phrH2 [Halorubrum sp. N11]|uniref:repressor phrH2 n=1 Tax=Halorubrum sp. N11 TaxID=3402276 RepID=UPI003EBA8FEE